MSTNLLRLSKHLATCALVYAMLAPSATPAAPLATKACDLVSKAKLQSILGASIEKVTLRSGIVEDSCSYRAAAGASLAGDFEISIYNVPVPDPEAGLMTEPGDTISPVSGIGDAAFMDANTHEFKFRVGRAWYLIVSRGAPCVGDKLGASRDVDERCAKTRNDMLTETAKLIIGGR